MKDISLGEKDAGNNNLAERGGYSIWCKYSISNFCSPVHHFWRPFQYSTLRWQTSIDIPTPLYPTAPRGWPKCASTAAGFHSKESQVKHTTNGLQLYQDIPMPSAMLRGALMQPGYLTHLSQVTLKPSGTSYISFAVSTLRPKCSNHIKFLGCFLRLNW